MNQAQLLKSQTTALINSSADSLAKACSDYWNEIEAFLLAKMFADGSFSSQYSKTYIYSFIDDQTPALEKKLREIADKSAEEAFQLGLLFFYLSIQEERQKAELAGSQQLAETKQALAQSVLLIPQNTVSRLKRLVDILYSQSGISEIAAQRGQEQLLKFYERQQSEQYFKQLLKDEAFVGIVDSRGYKWNPEVYAKMALRTRLMQSDNDIQRTEGLRNGIDLAWISSHNADNPCHNWEYVLISMNGQTSGFFTYEQTVATKEIWHPNCMHYLNPVRDISLAPASVITTSEMKYGRRLL